MVTWFYCLCGCTGHVCSLDASSTAIQVTVKAGGLKMLQIQDNGCGIHVSNALHDKLSSCCHC